jgi:hypothetical protein
LKFEPNAEIGQISADFEMERFEIGSKGCLQSEALAEPVASMTKGWLPGNRNFKK